MNKQELIEKIDNLQYSLSWNIPLINKEIVLDLIEQLDEPQKPVVPLASGGESIIIKHTRKELEEAGFGEVFDSPLFEVEEVEE